MSLVHRHEDGSWHCYDHGRLDATHPIPAGVTPRCGACEVVPAPPRRNPTPWDRLRRWLRR